MPTAFQKPSEYLAVYEKKILTFPPPHSAVFIFLFESEHFLCTITTVIDLYRLFVHLK